MSHAARRLIGQTNEHRLNIPSSTRPPSSRAAEAPAGHLKGITAVSTPQSSAAQQGHSVPSREAPAEEQPDSHGKFSLSEDWLATIAGLVILTLALFGLVPDIGEWFG